MYIQNRKRLKDTENKLVITKWEGGGGQIRGMGVTDTNYYI